MNQKRELNRRILLSSLVLIFICSIFSSLSMDTRRNLSINNDSAQVPTSSGFEGSGRYFQVNQYATAISSTYNVYPTTTSSFTLTDDWTAENISIIAKNVSRYQNYIQNGLFPSLIGGNYPYWSWYYNTEYISPDNRSNYLSIDVGENIGEVMGPLSAGNKAYYYQSISIDEEENPNYVVEFSFDTRIYSSGNYNVMFYAAVIVDGVEYNYTRRMSTMSTYQWYYNTLTWYLSDVGQSLPGGITFRLGTYVDGYVASYYNDQHFDNVEFNVYTYIDEPYAMYARDLDTSINYNYENTSSGQGRFIISGVQKDYPSTQNVQFQIIKNASLTGTVRIDNLTITADLFNILNSSYSSFQDGAFPDSNDILWTFDGSLSIPSGYFDKWVEIEKPDDWQILSVVDPFLSNKTASCSDLGVGTTKFSIPDSVFFGGEWSFRARSKSWFDDAKLEFWNGASFEEKTEFYVNEAFHVRVNINDTVALTNTNLNFTIYNPNGTVFYEIHEEPTSFEYYYGNFTVGISNMTVGMYTAEVSWTNNLTSAYVDKVGYKTFEFSVIHHTQLTTHDSMIESVPGEPLLILVEFIDTDTGIGIDLASVEYNSTFEQTGSLMYLGSGYYFLDLDTSSLEYDDYFLSFNATKPYYVNQTQSNLVQLKLEREGMILEVPRQVKSASANSFALFNFNLTGEISEMYLHPANISTDWIAPYWITDYSNGTYQLNVSTTGVISSSFPETYVINLYANKTNYSETADILLLQVNPIAAVIAANQTFVHVSQGSHFHIKVNYTESESGILIDGAACLVTWVTGYITTPKIDGFEIEFNTSGLALDQYMATVQISKSGFQTRTIFITILVDPISTSLTANQTLIIAEQGKIFRISVNYTEDSTGDPVTGASCSVSWLKDTTIFPTADGFDIEFNTTGLDIGQYTGIIQVNRTGYETQNLFITVLIEPLFSELVLLNIEPVEFFIGDQASLSVEFLVDEQNFGTGTISLIGDIEGDFIWNGTAYVLEFDTSSLEPKIYYSQIYAHAPGVQTQIYDLFIRIQPVELDVTVSSTSIIITESGSNYIYITVYDSSHGQYIVDANIVAYIDELTGNIVSLGNGTYTLDLDQFALNPAINPYSLHISIANPNGDDESFLITVVVPRNWNLYWWIAGSVVGTILLGVSTLLMYNRYVKHTRFQRNVTFIKKNIANIPKIKTRQEMTREKLVLEMINKEIDQLL